MNTSAERQEMLTVMVENGNYSEWETNFLHSIIEQLDSGRTLTEKQEDKLLQIQRRE